MKLNRKLLIAIVSILVIANVVFLIIDKKVDDNVANPYVRFVTTTTLSQAEMDKLIGLASDPVLAEKFNFAIIDGGNARLQSHIQEYKINGTEATLLTDRTGKTVVEKHAKLLTKEELLKLADKY